MKKKGFTLIEVLSVIVVLSIIFSISVPKILDIVEKSRRKVFFTSATSIVNTVKTEYFQNLYNKNFGYKSYEFDKKYPSGYKQNSETLKLKGDLPSIGTVKLKDNGKIALAVVSHDERYCAKKDYSDAEVKVEDYVFGKCNLEVDGAIIGEEFQINITASPLEWSRSKEVTITHNADDRAKLQYQLGTTTGEWIDYQDTFVLEENTTIYARLYTSTNSIESSLTVTTIDREGPEIISSTNNITTKSAKVYYNITDSKSGVDNSSITCKYGDNYSENGTVVISSGNSVTCTMSGLKNNTEYKYKISAKDKLGNESIKESSITTGDFSTIAITEKSTGNIYEKWSTSKQITITSSLPTGTKLQYQLGTTTGSWTNYSSPFELTSNTTIYARITDDSNVSKAASLTVTTIDRIGPNTPTISLGYGSSGVYMGGYTNGTWTKYDVLTTANSSDSGSGIAYYQYSHDATTWYADISTLGWSYAYANGKNILAYWITWSGSWNFYIRAVDNLGNVSAPSNVFTLRIDKEPPTISNLGIIGVEGTVLSSQTSSQKAYLYSSIGTPPMISYSATDVGGSGIKSQSVSCTGNNIELLNGNKVQYQKREGYTNVNCIVTIMDNAGNKATASTGPFEVGSGWMAENLGDINNEKWYYYDASTKQFLKGEQNLNWYKCIGTDSNICGTRTDTYYFDQTGLMLKGFQKVNGNTRFFVCNTNPAFHLPEGSMLKGSVLETLGIRDKNCFCVTNKSKNYIIYEDGMAREISNCSKTDCKAITISQNCN